MTTDEYGPCYRCGKWRVPEGHDCFECKERDRVEGRERPPRLRLAPTPRSRASALAERGRGVTVSA